MWLSLDHCLVHLAGLATLASTVHAATCRPLNDVYPPPRNVTNSLVTSASDRLTSIFKDLLQNETLATVTNTTSFSLNTWSLHETEPLWTYHYSAPSLATSTDGVKEVNSDTIYRLGSVSKLWTLYIWLLNTGDEAFNEPITKYIAELADYASSHDTADALNVIDWNSITIGALASQLSGIPRDVAFGPQLDTIYQKLLGLPPPAQEISNTSFCADSGTAGGVPCDRAAFFQTNLFRPPVLPPFESPAYANIPYQILAYALENITNTSFTDLFQNELVNTHNLHSTFYSEPPSSNNSIIPINASVSYYNENLRDGNPYGGYYSSLNDVTAIARAILNSTHLSSAQTRRWMKPVSFAPASQLTNTGGVFQAVGSPWEIIRAPAPVAPLLGTLLGVSPNTTANTAAQNYQTWLYAKTGDIGAYSAITVLIPEFDFGFNILAAGTEANSLVAIVGDLVTEIFIPAMFEAARTETGTTYAGTFTDSGTNSTATLSIPDATDQDQGLIVSELIYNGTDLLEELGSLLHGLTGDERLDVRLYPDGLESSVDASGTVTEGWRAAFDVPTQGSAAGAFSSACWDWAAIGGTSYGGIAFDDIRFQIQTAGDGSRSATGMALNALRLNMTKSD